MAAARGFLLLGTTALAGAGLLSAPPALAAEARPGGALDVTVTGFVRFFATGGDLDNARLDDAVSSGLDFLNDTEVHLVLAGRNDATGLEYGGKVELEADTSATANADETWLYLRSGWGEVKFGDEDGIADFDGMAVSAASVAAGTGGLDGDVVEIFGGGVRTYDLLGTSDSSKIIYSLKPETGLQLGLSYTPNLDGIDSGSGSGDALAPKGVEAGDVVEAAVGFAAELGGGAAGKVVLSGLHGDIKDEDEAGGDDFWGVQIGAAVELFGVELGGSYLTEEVGGIEADAVTLGAGVDIGEVGVSINYGRVVDSDGITDGDNELDKPWTVILSADVGLLPGLSLAGDVAYFDNDVRGEVVDADDDDGWQGVARLGLAF
jgi:outer membrane protein OmpU